MNHDEFNVTKLKLLRRAVFDKLAAYTPGEQPQNPERWIKLNTNENPNEPLPEVMEELANAMKNKLRLYPDPNAFELRKNFASIYLARYETYHSVENIVVANGSDEIIDIVFKTFIEPGDKIITLNPSYGMYSVLAETYGANERILELTEDFSLPESAFNQIGKLFIICSPNNPTGNCIPLTQLSKVCETFPGIVLVDDTYGDFASSTALTLLPKYPNLIVTRTFSKSMSLASARIGFAIASKAICDLFNTIRLPYNVSYFSQLAGNLSLKYWDKNLLRINELIAERNRVIGILGEIGFKILPTQANFYFMELENETIARNIFKQLKDRFILVRYWDKPRLNRYLRITVGAKEQNDILIKNLKELKT
jgi:histidinol-phosphate aminotransferase